MSERGEHFFVPDVLRPPDYFRELEIAETNRLIDYLVAPAHERVGILPEDAAQERKVTNEGTVRLVQARQITPKHGDPYIQRLALHSQIDSERQPLPGLTYEISHELSYVYDKQKAGEPFLHQMHTVFEAQYRNGYMTAEDFAELLTAKSVIYTEGYKYVLQRDLPVSRLYVASVKVQHQPQGEAEPPAYSSARLAFMNSMTARTFPEGRSLTVLDQEATEGLLTGDTDHEKRLISVLYLMGLVSEHEIRQYAGVS
ncbi:MAG TPA: hypothetical protein VD907_04575 [Verrucomicrobiae bacterium]|nr:hypothetical protein [Verrucomicrobiae bacterium]